MHPSTARSGPPARQHACGTGRRARSSVPPTGGGLGSCSTTCGHMATNELLPDTVAERLRADDTRAHTIHALDALPAHIPRELALAAVPALVDVAATTNDRQTLDRCALRN